MSMKIIRASNIGFGVKKLIKFWLHYLIVIPYLSNFYLLFFCSFLKGECIAYLSILFGSCVKQYSEPKSAGIKKHLAASALALLEILNCHKEIWFPTGKTNWRDQMEESWRMNEKQRSLAIQ